MRINLPNLALFLDPLLLGTRATVPVAVIMFDLGVDPWDAGPLRFSRVFDAMNVMGLIPAQQGRIEGYDLTLLPSIPLSCFVDVAELFGFGTPYDVKELPGFPRRQPLMSCDQWRHRLGMDQKQ